MKAKNLIIGTFGMVIFTSCGNGHKTADAYGNFETTEINVSSEGSGKLMKFDIEEGKVLKAGDYVGYIDTMQLYLKKKQLQATIEAYQAKVPDISVQINVITEQLNTAKKEKLRIENLLKSGAATDKQLDDINAQIELFQRQISATHSSLTTQSSGILAELEPLKVQILQVEDMIQKSIIINPINGTVLSKFSQPGELAGQGKILYKIADIRNIILRAYVSGEQLSQIIIGQEVDVFIDVRDGNYTKYSGNIIWVADKAEFTPKIIQTKDERVNLVYAIKVMVQNDGKIKIGMPGELKLKLD